jgi:hypothetical protein
MSFQGGSPPGARRARRGAPEPGPGGGASTALSTSRDLTSIDGVIADLAERQARLTAYLEQVLAEGGDIAEVAKVFALHGQNASRLGRLLRDQRALSGDSADGLLDAIGKALDEISTELGIKL